MDLDDKPAYLTTREAAAMLGVSLRTAQLWSESGIIEAWKTDGGHRRITRSSIERLIKEGVNSRRNPQAPADGAGSRTDAQPRLDRLRVLVVEDDNVLLKLYRMRMGAWNLPIELSTASNGYDGLLLVGRELPDVMIADLRMPGINGFDMIRKLSASAFREGMEILVVTGLSAEEIEREGGLPTDVRVLPKPVPFQQIQEICEALLARRQALSSS
ncbi:MAG: response regulator [Candidatus Methylumidiphilus sp.]